MTRETDSGTDSHDPVATIEATPSGPGLRDAINHILMLFLVALSVAAVVGLTALLTAEACLTIGYLFGLAFVLQRVVRNSKGSWRSYFPFRRVGVRAIALAITGGFAIKVTIVALARLLPFYARIRFEATPDVGPPVLALILIGVIGPVGEELFVRGWMFSGFMARYSPAKAIVLSATLFAVLHVRPLVIVAAFASGCFYAWMVKRTGSVIPAIAAHAANNTVATLATLYWPG